MECLFYPSIETFAYRDTKFLNKFAKQAKANGEDIEKIELFVESYRWDYAEMLVKAFNPKGEHHIFTFGDFKEVQDEIKRIDNEPEYDLFKTSKKDKLNDLIQLYTLKREFVFDIYQTMEFDDFYEISQYKKKYKNNNGFGKFFHYGEITEEEREEKAKEFLLSFYPKHQALFRNLNQENIHIEMEKLFFKIHNHFYNNFKEAILAFKVCLDEKYFEGKNIDIEDKENNLKEPCLFNEEELKPSTQEVKSYDEIMERRIRKKGR